MAETSTTQAAAKRHPIVRAVGSPWFWVLFVGLLFSFPIIGAIRRQVPDPPQVFFELPKFTLTDHLGRPFGSEDLTGKVWIANFIFTSCPTRCPALTETMAKVQKRLRHMGDSVMLVSFSVDPERDTPEKLGEYAKKYQANPRRWRFLTGDLDDVEAAIVKGFKMPMEPGEPPPEQPELFDITHGTRFVLVDQHGRVRGFFETDEQGINDMLSDLAILANLGDAPPSS